MTRTRGDGLALETVVPVDPATAGSLVDPTRLAEWFCSAVRVDGDAVDTVLEEEYGYRRRLACRIVDHVPRRRLELRVDAATREWDGCDGTPVGPVATASSWEEHALEHTRIQVSVDDGIARLRWSDLADDALDAARREGTLVRYAVDRAVESFGAAPVAVLYAQAPIPVSADVAWLVLDDGDGRPHWLGRGATLEATPGSAWRAPTPGGNVGGRVLLAVAGRRLAASWRPPGREGSAGLLDLQLTHERGQPCELGGCLQVVDGVDQSFAAEWLDQVVDALASATSEGGRGA